MPWHLLRGLPPFALHRRPKPGCTCRGHDQRTSLGFDCRLCNFQFLSSVAMGIVPPNATSGMLCTLTFLHKNPLHPSDVSPLPPGGGAGKLNPSNSGGNSLCPPCWNTSPSIAHLGRLLVMPEGGPTTEPQAWIIPQAAGILGNILGLYWDNGKENGIYYGIYGEYNNPHICNIVGSIFFSIIPFYRGKQSPKF